MPSIDEFAQRDETRQKVLDLKNPVGKTFSLWVEYYINRLTAEPIRVSEDDLDPEEGETGKNTLRGAQSFCDVVHAWDLTGPVLNRSGETIVPPYEPVPLQPQVIRLLPAWLTDSVTRHLVEDVFPSQNGSRPSRRR